jgi:hypothetical protein
LSAARIHEVPALLRKEACRELICERLVLVLLERLVVASRDACNQAWLLHKGCSGQALPARGSAFHRC